MTLKKTTDCTTTGTQHLPVQNSSVWDAQSFTHDSSWLHPVQPVQAQEVIAAAKLWHGREFRSLQRTEVQASLPSWVAAIAKIQAELGSRGFALIRGVPVESLAADDIQNIYWAIGLLLGQGLTQNALADFLCPVTDMGVNFGYDGTAEQQNVRGYQSKADLNYHCDPTDVVALLCVRKAREGGVSTIVSTPAIYNEMAAHHRDQLELLMPGFPYDRKGEQAATDEPITPRIPIFHRHGDQVSCRYARSYILGAARKFTALSDAQLAALDCFDQIARRPGMALHIPFEPGDIQLLNNFTVVHGRTAYTDDPQPDQRRFLWRLWLHMGEEAPWSRESEEMRWAFARFGSLGRNVQEWAEMSEQSA